MQLSLEKIISKSMLVICIQFINIRYAEYRNVTRSVIGMKKLLKAEKLLVMATSNYVKHMEKKLSTMQDMLKDLKLEHAEAEMDAEAYLGNPLKSFALIRRLHTDWQKYEYFLSEVPDLYNVIPNYDSVLPNDQDLSEAVNGMHRIQSTYELRVEDMTAGLLNGVWYNSKLSVEDTLTIGHELYKNNKMLEAIPWLNASLNLLSGRELRARTFHVDNKKICAIYIDALLIQNFLTDDLKVTNDACSLYSGDSEFFELLENLFSQRMHRSKEKNMTEDPTLKHYNQLCRGSYEHSSQNLHCHFYSATMNPFTILAPFRIEELSLAPYIVLYYDVIYEHEIEEVKRITTPNLKTAILAENNDIFKESRIAKASALSADETETIKRLNQRISDMTGFNLTASKFLEIINYGLGGHYEPHYDAFRVAKGGRKILNDVEQGGHTVFPTLDIGVQPRRGQAVLWYNVHNNGDYNRDVLHGACPVLVGSKWVLTKWIEDNDQFQLGFGPINTTPLNNKGK